MQRPDTSLPLPWTNGCYVCGEGNPVGLHMRFTLRGDVPPSHFYGMNPIVSTQEQNGHFDVQMFGFAFPIAPGGEAHHEYGEDDPV